MKYTFYLLLCLFSLSLGAQKKAATTGMTFVEKPFADLLAQAKAEDKVIFIDAYTTWCGPCKMMAAKVFPLEAVGEVYNERFINAKFDMEKGEGPGLAQRYSVAAYPTYLFIDGKGDIVHKGLGYIPQDAFLALADAAISPNSLGALNKRYDGGERGSEFVLSYAQTLNDVYENERAATVISNYLDGLKDWSDPAVLGLIIDNPGKPGDKGMRYLVDNADAAIALVGPGKYAMTLQRSLVTQFMEDAGARILPPKEKMEALYEQHAAPQKDRLMLHYAMFHAEQSQNMEAYIPAAIAYLGTYGSTDYVELNTAAWNVYESSDDPNQLKTALSWAQESVAINANYANLDTLAWLYSKMGNKEKAQETARKAIEMAKADGTDYSDTERILKQ